MTEVVAKEKYDKVVELAEEAMTKWEAETERRLQDKKEHTDELLRVMNDKKLNRSDSQMKANDLNKIGRDLIGLVEEYGSKRDASQGKKEYLRQLVKEEDPEALQGTTLEELQGMERESIRKNIVPKFKDKMEEFGKTYNELREQSRPDLTPSGSDLDRINAYQESVKARTEGVEDPGELADIFMETLKESNNEWKREATYELVKSKIKNKGDQGALQKVEGARRAELLSSNQRDKLKKWEATKAAEGHVETFQNWVKGKLDEVDDPHTDVDAENVKEDLENGAGEFLNEAVNTIKGD